MTPPPARATALPPPPPGRSGWPWTVAGAPPADAPPGGWPRLSIVCPSFNQGRFLEETLRSVLLQGYPDLELIVIDGGSRDASVALLEQYSPWIAYWHSRPDGGQSHAINLGCARATGEVLGWINSDDYYLPGAFAAVGRAFRACPRGLLYGDWAERQDEAPELVHHRERPAFRFQVAVGGRHLPSHATFWPRAAHLPVDESLRFTLDADLFKRLAASGLRPRHIPQALGVFRRHADAKTAQLLDVARAETEAWSRAQPWHTPWRWRLSRLLDRATAACRRDAPRP
ncbi:MAG: glycosyltransferase [Opitutaceae bacterium]|nr:glycosyltransferase [Opitutaceae bacterium]